MKANNSRYLLDKLEYLNKVPLFLGLNSEQVKKMVKIMRTEKFEKDQFIIKEGDTGSNLFILMEGSVEISKTLVLPQCLQNAQKQEKSLIRLSEKQYPFFGELAMFDDKPERSASIKAITPSLMAVITKDDFIKVVTKNPEMGMQIYKNIASELGKRLKKANRDILKLTTAFTLAIEG